MKRFQTTKRCRWLFVLSGLLVFAALAGSPADAKGPKPKPDIFIEMLGGDFVATGAIEETGFRDRVLEWNDDDGVVWILWRFHHGADDPSYFDIVLPKHPKKGTKYAVELTAGPAGYLSGGVLYEGTFAVGTATGSTREEWYWWYDYWLDKRVKQYRTIGHWDPLEAYLLP